MNDFVEHYFEILSDPAHLAVELTLMLLVDVLFLGLTWPLVTTAMNRAARKAAHAEHLIIDAEHGVEHPIPFTHQEL